MEQTLKLEAKWSPLEVRVHEDIIWQALQERERRFDGFFFFAVKSTGVYCRPSCPARRPKRENVLFYIDAGAAERDGFRPCSRCRPREVGAVDPRVKIVIEVCRIIDASPDMNFTLEELGAKVGMSSGHLQRTFKSALGISPKQYCDALRTRVVKSCLRESDSVTDAVYMAGYGSGSRLYERAASRLGMTPATFKRGGMGAAISFTIVDTPLGRLLVARTSRGICHLCLGDSDSFLEGELHRDYPAAAIRKDDAELRGWVSAVVEFLEGRLPHLDLPLDVRATAFQRMVWEALRGIPTGTTLSYSDVAKRLGRPRASRAVARACATNLVSLIIPCHRVVRKDGGLGGYRWGIDRKRALLEIEQRYRSSGEG